MGGLAYVFSGTAHIRACCLRPCMSMAESIFGGYCGGVPPLPIPNREVKPACADGTAMRCGRVGGRLFLSCVRRGAESSGGRFFCWFFEYGGWNKMEQNRTNGTNGPNGMNKGTVARFVSLLPSHSSFACFPFLLSLLCSYVM